MRNRKVWLSVAAIVVVAVVVALVVRRAAHHEVELTIRTGTPEGTYHPLGKQMARVLSRLDGITAIDVESEGSIENIEKVAEDAHVLGLAMEPALTAGATRNVRTLARLYTDVVYVLARTDLDVQHVTDLRGSRRRTYIGNQKSGTRIVAQTIIETLGLDCDDYHDTRDPDASVSFAEAVDLLTAEPPAIDVAFIVAGERNAAVQRAMATGRVTLLGFADDDALASVLTADNRFKLQEKTILHGTFTGQDRNVKVVSGDTYLICHADLDDDIAERVVTTLFDDLADLLVTHARADEIRFTWAFAGRAPVPRHPGAQRFLDARNAALIMPTASLGGSYFTTGKKISQCAFYQHGIEAHVWHTSGSLENARLLARDQPVVAMVQFDVAVSALDGSTVHAYGQNWPGVPSVPGLQQIVRLHDEVLYILQNTRRRGWGDAETVGDARAVLKGAAERDPKAICVGADDSGTQLAARSVLGVIGIDDLDWLYLPSHEAVSRLRTGDIEIAFFMAAPGNRTIADLVAEKDIRPLTLDPTTEGDITNETVFEMSGVEIGTGDSLLRVRAVSTPVLLVANEHVDDVYEITDAILGRAESFLDMEPGSLVKRVKPFSIHPDAMQAFREHRLALTPASWFQWQDVGTTLAILVILTGAVSAVVRFKRDRISNEIGRRVVAISIDAEEPDTIAHLVTMRHEIDERVRRRWWRIGEIDQRRWQHLYGMIESRMTIARVNLARWLAGAIRHLVARDDLDPRARLRRFETIERRVWESFTLGEIDADQKQLLTSTLESGRELINGHGARGGDGKVRITATGAASS
jgi:TRAP transporter TAXI family solute receptor